MKGQEGMKFWLNAESIPEITAHRVPIQHLDKPGEGY